LYIGAVTIALLLCGVLPLYAGRHTIARIVVRSDFFSWSEEDFVLHQTSKQTIDRSLNAHLSHEHSSNTL
jgi:hypothetical protein